MARTKQSWASKSTGGRAPSWFTKQLATNASRKNFQLHSSYFDLDDKMSEMIKMEKTSKPSILDLFGHFR